MTEEAEVVVLFGHGQEGQEVLEKLPLLRGIKVAAVTLLPTQPPGGEPLSSTAVPANKHGFFVAGDLTEVLSIPGLKVIIETSGEPQVVASLRAMAPSHVSIVEIGGWRILLQLLTEMEELLRIKAVKEELDTILNSALEGIQVASSNGTITYVNPAFTTITGIKPEERIGKSVFDVSPGGALAQVLRTGSKVFGFRNRVLGTDVEVISNAAPIVVDGEMKGAVVIFQDISDINRLNAALNESKTIIEGLHNELQKYTKSKYTFQDIIGQDRKLVKAIEIAKRAAATDSAILLEGESGTGKEIMAHAIHNHSQRREKPFISVNCAAVPDNLLESELFGHEKGAFTGAIRTRLGRFELADGGTLFLDEVQDMSLSFQAKLLRVLQEGEFERVGGSKTIKVNVRIIAASNRDLRVLARQGRFRSDLYYRLEVIRIHLPPLRERRGDIPALAEYILGRVAARFNRRFLGFTQEAIDYMVNYNWLGNVRELENLLERAVTLTNGPYITVEDLRAFSDEAKEVDSDKGIKGLQSLEADEIARALRMYGTDLVGKRAAAKALGISLATLYNKIKRYGIH